MVSEEDKNGRKDTCLVGSQNWSGVEDRPPAVLQLFSSQ